MIRLTKSRTRAFVIAGAAHGVILLSFVCGTDWAVAQTVLFRSSSTAGGGLAESPTVAVQASIGLPVVGRAVGLEAGFFVGTEGELGTGSEDREAEELPKRFELRQNYPNPFNPSTLVVYAIPKPSDVTLTLFDALGRKHGLLDGGRKPAGYHTVTIDATRLASGIYFYRLEAGKFVDTKQMVVFK